MTLKLDIFTQNIENTDRIKEYVDKKVSKLDKYLKGIDDTRIDLSYVKSARNSSDRYVAQITIRGKGFILRSEERSDEIFSALDAASDKILRQIRRYKGKRSRGRGYSAPPSDFVEDIVEIEEEVPVIAKRKEFSLVPMNELEAIEQMKLLGHENFFVFFNGDSNQINILYKRRSGDYGIILPRIG